MSRKPNKAETAKTSESKKPVELETEDLDKVDGGFLFGDGAVRGIKREIDPSSSR